MAEFWYQCFECGAKFDPSERLYTCPRCGGLLEVELDLEKVKELAKNLKGPLSVWRYSCFLPVRDPAKAVTLGEGGTPLYRCERLASELGVRELYVKYEGANPTGSFKDRGMTVGVTKAIEYGVKVVACASTGNTSASLAAYAAKAGLRCLVLLPKGKVALGKLAQAMIHGAEVIGIRGNFDQALSLVTKLCRENSNVYLLNSVNPFRPQGQKTIGFEVAEQLGYEVPDKIIVPMGNCANIWAIYKGFMEFQKTGLLDRTPQMIGIQAEGAKPIVEAIKKGLDTFIPVPNPETIATAIRIGNPVNGPKAIRAIRKSGGTAESVTDEEIVEAQKLLARTEGIGVEPASASTIAGLKKMLDLGAIGRDEIVVCIATGSVMKDPEEVVKVTGEIREINVDYEELLRVIK